MTTYIHRQPSSRTAEQYMAKPAVLYS